MKILAILLVAIGVYTFIPTAHAQQFLKMDRPESIETVQMVEDTTPKPKPVTAIPVASENKSAKPTEKPVAKPAPKQLTWRDNPNKCDLNTQIVRADNLQCKDKPRVVADKPAPKRTATATTVSRSAPSGSCDLAYNYNWPARTARAVCMAESSGNPAAVGDTNTAYPSCGLMQIRTLPGRPSCGQLMNGSFNMNYAYNMWKGQGFGPWTAYTKGLYLKYY